MKVKGVTQGRKVSINNVLFETASTAARNLGIPLPTLYTRLMSQSPTWREWFYADGRPTPVIRYGKVKPKFFVCYLLTHTPTGMVYVGSTGNLSQRKAVHLYYLRKNKHPAPELQKLFDIKKDFSDFTWSIFVCNGRLHMQDFEQELVDTFYKEKRLLNASLNTRAPILENLKNPEIQQRRIDNHKKAWINRASVIRKRISTGMKSRWQVPGARETIKGGGNPFAKKVSVNGVVYGSVKDAQSALGINEKTIRKRANSPEYPEYTFNVN